MGDLKLHTTSDNRYVEFDVVADAWLRQRLIGQELRRWYDFIPTKHLPDEPPAPIDQVEGEV